MAVVIADAGPLIAFAKIGELSILQKLFVEVIVTKAVLSECLIGNGIDSQRIKAALEQGWIKSVANPELLTVYSRSLGIGEKTSMEFALNLDEPVLLIMDDRLARKKARHLNLEVVGTAMLLYKAQSLGYLANADEQVLLLRQSGYRISEVVIAEITKSDI